MVTLDASASAYEAAQRMRDAAIGDVLVTDASKMRGILTDRDLVVRCLATQQDPRETRIGDICSEGLVTASADDEVHHAAELMKNHAIRRLPVVESGRVVGIVTLGDLALERDPDSALASVSSAPPDV